MVAAAIRRCKGSERFGIEPHDAPVTDFPRQPSQKDGLGRMCTTHWNAYTAALAREAKARTTAETGELSATDAGPTETPPDMATPKRKRSKQVPTPEAAAQGDGG